MLARDMKLYIAGHYNCILKVMQHFLGVTRHQ